MSNGVVVWDVETGPLPEDQLREMLPPFDPADVKLGNLKDEAKIAEKLKSAEASHLADFISRAALSPLTGRVLAIGVLSTESGKHSIIDGGGDEEDLLNRWWSYYLKNRNSSPAARRTLAGWNIFGFDLPFLVRRSWLHGVAVPMDKVRDANDRYWDGCFVDLMSRFAVGEWKAHVKLDMAARFFGVGKKTGSGADFAKLWFGSPEQKNEAILYLQNDLKMTSEVAKRIGVAA